MYVLIFLLRSKKKLNLQHFSFGRKIQIPLPDATKAVFFEMYVLIFLLRNKKEKLNLQYFSFGGKIQIPLPDANKAVFFE